jgi:hypothetical protein
MSIFRVRLKKLCRPLAHIGHRFVYVEFLLVKMTDRGRFRLVLLLFAEDSTESFQRRIGPSLLLQLQFIGAEVM